MDATLVTAHSDKEGAAPTSKRGFGHHPLWAFVDHGTDGTGEPLSVLLRPDNAGSNPAGDHIVVIGDAPRQLPGHRPGTRPGHRVLVRAGARVAEVTELLDLSRWPAGMRVIVRRERPHPGAQLRITDADGHRITAFAHGHLNVRWEAGRTPRDPDLNLRPPRSAASCWARTAAATERSR